MRNRFDYVCSKKSALKGKEVVHERSVFLPVVDGSAEIESDGREIDLV